MFGVTRSPIVAIVYRRSWKHVECLESVLDSKAKKMVEAKKTTWEELESMGMVESKATDKFTQAFNKKKEV